MEAFGVLVLLPLVVGVAAARCITDTRYATLGAVVGTIVVVALAVALLDRGDRWGWIAALMVTPLTAAFAVAAAWLCHARRQARRHRGAHRA
jgi:hypothetical protein